MMLASLAKRLLLFFTFFVTVWTFSSVHAGADGLPDFSRYQLYPQDIVTITILGEDALSGPYRVQSSGVLDLPMVGAVQAAGLTRGALQHSLTQHYRDGYLVAPDIRVNITAYRPFYILGEVQKPGQYPYNQPLTVRQAVAMAGGFTYRAAEKTMEIKRAQVAEGQATQGKARADDYFMPGDTIIVKERLF